eukprot:symbB.v1.2.000888.t2/scaffold51.1/size380723/7
MSRSLRVVVMSDTHNKHQQLEVPEGDILIHCGDLTNRGSAPELQDVNAWLEELPHRHKLVICGNMDKRLESQPSKAARAKSVVTYLEDDAIEIEGLRFYASPFTPKFCGAFQCRGREGSDGENRRSSSFWQGHLEVQLRHHITNLRREDRDLFWEGIESLKGEELIDVCRRRAIRFHGVTEEEMREDLNRWLRLSANHRQIPTSMLLWIQSFYLRDRTEDETSTEALKLKVQEQEEIENPEEAFLSFAERQKEAVDKMEQKLEELQREIVEVTEQHQDVLQELDTSATTLNAAGGTEACANCGHLLLADSVYCRKCGHKREQADLDYDDPEGEKRRMLQILRKVEEDLDLYKQVVQKQRLLQERQLRYLLAMRDTTPTCQKDANVILLDQRVRLLEMIGAFQQNAEEIDQLFNNTVSKEAETVVSSSMWDDFPGDPIPIKEQRRVYHEEARVKEMFAQLDIRGRGAIGPEDLQTVLSNSVHRKENSLRRFVDMVKEFDLNGDGYLDPSEFRKMLREELWSEGPFGQPCSGKSKLILDMSYISCSDTEVDRGIRFGTNLKPQH